MFDMKAVVVPLLSRARAKLSTRLSRRSQPQQHPARTRGTTSQIAGESLKITSMDIAGQLTR
eukprot:5380556-Pyramimonas_sp.AAC.1